MSPTLGLFHFLYSVGGFRYMIAQEIWIMWSIIGLTIIILILLKKIGKKYIIYFTISLGIYNLFGLLLSINSKMNIEKSEYGRIRNQIETQEVLLDRNSIIRNTITTGIYINMSNSKTVGFGKLSKMLDKKTDYIANKMSKKSDLQIISKEDITHLLTNTIKNINVGQHDEKASSVNIDIHFCDQENVYLVSLENIKGIQTIKKQLITIDQYGLLGPVIGGKSYNIFNQGGVIYEKNCSVINKGLVIDL